MPPRVRVPMEAIRILLFLNALFKCKFPYYRLKPDLNEKVIWDLATESERAGSNKSRTGTERTGSFQGQNCIWNPSSQTTSSSMYAAKSLQSCPTLCDPIDGSPPGFTVPGILQARTLEWVAISFSNAWKWKVKVKSLSRVRLSATPWTAAHQAPPSMGFSRQEYWSGVPLPSPVQCIRANNRNLELERLTCYLVSTQKLGKFVSLPEAINYNATLSYAILQQTQSKVRTFTFFWRAEKRTKWGVSRTEVAISSWHVGEILWEPYNNYHSRFCFVFQKAIVYE